MQLGHESISEALLAGWTCIHRTGGEWKIRGSGAACDVHISLGVQREAADIVLTGTAEVRSEKHLIAASAQFQHRTTPVTGSAPEFSLYRTRRHRQPGLPRIACNVHLA